MHTVQVREDRGPDCLRQPDDIVTRGFQRGKKKRRSIKLPEAGCLTFEVLVVLDSTVVGTEPLILAGTVPAAGILPQTRVFGWLGRLEGYHLVAPWSLAQTDLSCGGHEPH